MRRGFVLFIVGVCSLTACGTGGEKKPSESATQPSAVTANQPSAKVGAPFAVRAALVCAAALKSKQAWAPFPVADFNPTDPDPKKFPEVATWLKEQVAPTFESWLADLRALGEPPTGGDAWKDVLTAVDGIVRLNEAQVVAAKSAGTEEFARATKDLGAIQPDLVRATKEAGVPTCADVHA